MAVSMAHALAVVLIERVPSCAARCSAPTWSTPGSPCRKVRNAESERVTSSYGGSGPAIGRAYADGASGSSTWVMAIIVLWDVLCSRPCSPLGVKNGRGSVDGLVTCGFVVRRVSSGGRLRTDDRVAVGGVVESLSDDELHAMPGPALLERTLDLVVSMNAMA